MMGEIFDASVTASAADRVAQHNRENIGASAVRYHIRPKTVARWKGRQSVIGLPCCSKRLRASVLSAEEEAIIVAFRRHSLLPIDDCLCALLPIIPHLTRLSLRLCLHRHAVSRLPEVLVQGQGPAFAKEDFERYPIGYLHIDIAEIQTQQCLQYLFVAIDRISKFAFVEWHSIAGELEAVQFLQRLAKALPYTIHTVLTDCDSQFIDMTQDRLAPEHSFARACREMSIDHKLTKVKHLWSNAQIDRMNATIEEAFAKCDHDDNQQPLKKHLQDFVCAYNFTRQLKTLNGLAPHAFICKMWAAEPERFIANPHHQIPGSCNGVVEAAGERETSVDLQAEPAVLEAEGQVEPSLNKMEASSLSQVVLAPLRSAFRFIAKKLAMGDDGDVYADSNTEEYEEYAESSAPQCAMSSAPLRSRSIQYAASSAPLRSASFSARQLAMGDGGDAYAYPNTEEYAEFEQNRFVSVTEKPLSTFGADVDTASYSIFRRQVYNGNMRSGLLRTEEMINYFRYDYPQPEAGEPFSITTEMTPCPWNSKTKLLRLGLATKHMAPEERPASNLVFLVDVSGSMDSEDKLSLLKKALHILVDQMGSEDRISMVTYASNEKLLLDGTTYKDRNAIKKVIDSLDADGATAGEKGMQMAYEVAQRNFIKGGNNRVIMGTDGDLNVGISSESELKRFIEDKRKTGVFLSVFGFGEGNLKDNKMSALAKNGNGNYSYIDTIIEARKVLQTELSSTLFVAAKDVKFQVDFNPGKVKGYRLIGYESRKLNAEDFADDKKDGGEIGAGHQVTVLYEIIDSESDYPLSTESKYQRPMQTVDSDEWFTLNIRYKAPDGDTSKLLSYPTDNRIWCDKMSPDMVLASAIAQVAMIANKSDFVGTATPDSVVKQLASVPAFQDDELKAEFVALVRRWKGLS